MTNKQDNEILATVITNMTGEPHYIEYAYGKPRLYKSDGSVEVSPRLSPVALNMWLRAYIKGIEDGRYTIHAVGID